MDTWTVLVTSIVVSLWNKTLIIIQTERYNPRSHTYKNYTLGYNKMFTVF